MLENVIEKASVPFDVSEENNSAEIKQTTSPPEPGTHTCSACGSIHPLTELTEVEGVFYCSYCLDSETVICSHCGCRVLLDDMAGTEDFPLCQRCYDDHYTSCECCGRIIHRDDANYDDDDSYEAYCSSCYRNHCRGSGIEDYYYKPDPIFYGNGTRYFGIELEVDGAGEEDDSADDVMYIGNRTANHIYCKHDGSLDEGFEIVTHPMTLDYHQKSMSWSAVLDELKGMGYLSHQATTCGLHVHVNRNSLGDTYQQQEDTIARILFFVESHWNEILKFSRRNERQMEQWASRYGRKDDPKEVLKTAKTSYKGRYTCVNLTNDMTIEFRMFRGTLKYNTLIATIQLVEKICDVALNLSDEMIKGVTWAEFVSGISQQTMPELIQYLKERRLYVNEPIETEEEI